MKTKFFGLLLGVLFFANACSDIGVFEKQYFFKQHAWQSTIQPSFDFTIKDTAALYNIYIAVRHEDAYRYNNLWVEITTQSPDSSWEVNKILLHKLFNRLASCRVLLMSFCCLSSSNFLF